MIIDRTTAICRHCQTVHPATIVHENGRIEAEIDCHTSPYRHLLSTHPELYLELRQRSFTNIDAPPPSGLRPVLNYLAITNACNFTCTVCAADASSAETGVFLPLEEILTRASRIAPGERGLLYLIGGEPTLHPQLIAIVSRLTEMGFHLSLASNGYLLGRDPELAPQLKAAGLKRIALQFDSVDRGTLDCYARDALEEKNAACRHAIAAGLDVHFNCTVTSHNLRELGQLLVRGLMAGDRVRNMTFMVAAPTGRFTLSEPEAIDRESVILALLEKGNECQFGFADILPLPAYLPWGVQVHPDCGVHIPFLRTPQAVFPLNRLVDIRGWYRRLAATQFRRQTAGARRLWPLLLFLCSLRGSKLPTTLRAAWGLALRRKGYSLVNVAISDYRAAMFLDEKRLARCATAYRTSVGPVPGCSYFFRDETFPGSRRYEFDRG